MRKIESKFPGKKILLVEDFVINQEITKEIMQMMECEVDIAEDGTDAVEMVQDNEYDLIIMDINMPEMDGYEATRQIRKMGNKTTIVALTANALQGDREKCLEAGMDDYIAKPVKGESLEEMMNKYFDAA